MDWGDIPIAFTAYAVLFAFVMFVYIMLSPKLTGKFFEKIVGWFMSNDQELKIG